jgi:hypothetical protein
MQVPVYAVMMMMDAGMIYILRHNTTLYPLAE